MKFHASLAALCLAIAAPWAASQTVSARLQSLAPEPDASVDMIVELWGTGSGYAWAGGLEGAALQALTARPLALANAANALWRDVDLVWSYDLSAPLTSQTVTADGQRGTARYATGRVELSYFDGLSRRALAAGPRTTIVQNGRSTNFLATSLAAGGNTVQGPIPGIAPMYLDAVPTPQVPLDLADFVSQHAVNGFDGQADMPLSLPVRLTGPLQYGLVLMQVDSLRPRGGAPLDLGLPDAGELQGWLQAGQNSLLMVVDGVYGVSVDPADYASSEAHQQASAWVAANVRQVNVEFVHGWQTSLVSVSAVPEPSSLAMMALGLLLWPAWQRRGRSRGLAG